MLESLVKKKLILASTSPRRREILSKIGLEFEIIPSDYEEVIDSPEFSYEKIETLAFHKAKAVYDKIKNAPEYSNSIILSADTVVVLDEIILGKPLDKNDAFAMIKKLSDKKHSVVTSICTIVTGNFQKKIHSETSFVEFQDLSDSLIINYVEQFMPLDKAGSYGIQELPDGFVKNIEGSFENIMGLCPNAVNNILKDILH